MRTSPVFFLLLAALLAACGPHRAAMVGYEMRDTEFSLQPEETHLETSVVGPIDLAVGRHQVPKDSVVGGLAESYVVLGIRFPFRVGDVEGALTNGVDGLATGMQTMGQLRSQRRVDGPGFIGTELMIDGTSGPHEGRAIYVRLYVVQDAFFILAAAADERPAGSGEAKYFEGRRTRFFDAFRATTPADGSVRQLTRDEAQAITKRLVSVAAL
ncbi:hypothetical protein [Labilithrix luteola]|nr:hypothetical protein [Labilithrix luteola]